MPLPDLPPSVECFLCARPFTCRQGGGRFCSDRCRSLYDDGFPRSRDITPVRYSLPLGSNGFLIDCAHCGKRFDSKGLRCCSPECERRLREQAANKADLRAAPATKRECEWCRQPIPRWRKGRAVPKSARYCSVQCRLRAWRERQNHGDGAEYQNRTFETVNAKEVPFYRRPQQGTRKPSLPI
jgi:predicted nucleic acid-binding Zn ribbon protein